jgi:hypothetical protein
MNNLKKVGLTALAGSMVAFSAQALDMSVSGQAKITYVDEGEGSVGRTDVTGNPYGFDQTLAFNGSGDTALGTVSVMHVYNNATGAASSSLLTIDMGDAGTVTLDGVLVAQVQEQSKIKCQEQLVLNNLGMIQMVMLSLSQHQTQVSGVIQTQSLV